MGKQQPGFRMTSSREEQPPTDGWKRWVPPHARPPFLCSGWHLSSIVSLSIFARLTPFYCDLSPFHVPSLGEMRTIRVMRFRGRSCIVSHGFWLRMPGGRVRAVTAGDAVGGAAVARCHQPVITVILNSSSSSLNSSALSINQGE